MDKRNQIHSSTTLAYTSTNQESTTLAVQDLEKRGWSRAMRDKFLKQADTTSSKMSFSSGRPQRLYFKERVAKIEALPEFQSMLASAKGRKEQHATHYQEKLNRLIEVARSTKFTLPEHSHEELTVLACGQFSDTLSTQDRMGREVDYLLANIQVSSGLKFFNGNPGIRPARTVLRGRYLAAISTHYPHLSMAVNSLSQDPEGLIKN